MNKIEIEKVFPEYNKRLETGAMFAAKEINNVNTPITQVKAERLAQTIHRQIESNIHNLPVGPLYDEMVGYTQINNPKREQMIKFISKQAEEMIRRFHK